MIQKMLIIFPLFIFSTFKIHFVTQKKREKAQLLLFSNFGNLILCF